MSILSSIGKPARVLSAGLIVFLALLSGLALQPASAQPVELQYLCVSRITAETRAVNEAGDCSRYEVLIDLAEDAPINVCAHRVTGVISARNDCTRYDQPLVLGDDETVNLCASMVTGQLRNASNVSCSRGERGTVVTAKEVQLTFDCVDCPLNVPLLAGTEGSVTSDLVVSDPAGGQITDVNVFIDLAHAKLDDLDIFLESPDGTIVELATDLCEGLLRVDLAVTFDDQAGTPVTSAPCESRFTGTYQPEGSLADFDGEAASGTWQLQITDDTARNAGLLWDWRLEINTDQGVLPPASCTDCLIVIPGTPTSGNNDNGVTVSRLPVTAGDMQVVDLDLTVDISHPWLGDLHIHLRSPAGTHVKVFDQSCEFVANLQVIFDDEAAGGLDCPTRLEFNAFQPAPGSLSDFDGEDASGEWALVIIDDDLQDPGTLNNWTLNFELK